MAFLSCCKPILRDELIDGGVFDERWWAMIVASQLNVASMSPTIENPWG
jgi:hypothetical protein